MIEEFWKAIVATLGLALMKLASTNISPVIYPEVNASTRSSSVFMSLYTEGSIAFCSSCLLGA